MDKKSLVYKFRLPNNFVILTDHKFQMTKYNDDKDTIKMRRLTAQKIHSHEKDIKKM